VITVFRKNWCKWSIIAAVIVLAVVVGLNQTIFRPQVGKDEVGNRSHQTRGRTDITKIEIILDENSPYWNELKPISITDNKMIDDIMTMVEESKPLTDESKMGKMSGMARKKQ
jgi:hypothetical protein